VQYWNQQVLPIELVPLLKTCKTKAITVERLLTEVDILTKVFQVIKEQMISHQPENQDHH
jgi:hypothetical protein